MSSAENTVFIGEAAAPTAQSAAHPDRKAALRMKLYGMLITLMLLTACTTDVQSVERDMGPKFNPVPMSELDPALTSVYKACVADHSLSPGVEELVGDALETVPQAMKEGKLSTYIVDRHTTPSVRIIAENIPPQLEFWKPEHSQDIGGALHEIVHAHILLGQLKKGVSLAQISGMQDTQYEQEEPMADFILHDMTACAERQGIPRNNNEAAWYYSTFGYKPTEVQQSFAGYGLTESSPTYAMTFWAGMALGREQKLREVQGEIRMIERDLQGNPNSPDLRKKYQQYYAWARSLQDEIFRDRQYVQAAESRATPDELDTLDTLMEDHEDLFSRTYMQRWNALVGGD